MTSSFLLCACTPEFGPASGQTGTDSAPRKYKVYVCGAVENEGYVEVEEGADYYAAITLAGIIPSTYLPDDLHTLIQADGEVISLSYKTATDIYTCINLNGGYIQYRRPVNDVDIDLINKIADYYDLHGKITNRKVLEDVLGDDYQDNYYKFFVSVDDYEEVS